MSEVNVGESEQIKIIGAGFGRTGTNSLRIALNELGYKTYHMLEVFQCNHPDLWLSEIKKEKQNFTENIFKKENFTACLDFPASS